MRVINKERGTGKTTALIYTSSVIGYPILTFSQDSAKLLKLKASQLGVEIPEPLCVSDLITRKTLGIKGIMEDVLVDETLTVLSKLLEVYNVNPVTVTLTSPEGVHIS